MPLNTDLSILLSIDSSNVPNSLTYKTSSCDPILSEDQDADSHKLVAQI